ncbi:6-phosphogluconate dehydrogenase [Deltaproteobacteria bacterium]|nr:6-phosphogluconate dehydrogenase [Deltaproteobacteria bacterium]
MLTPKKIAVIGFGEAGTVVAEGCAAGARKLQQEISCHAWDIRMKVPEQKAALQKTADTIGVVLHESPAGWLGEMDVVFSLVFGTAAKEVALEILPYLREGAQYIDLTTSLPADMIVAGEAFAARKVGFIDGTSLGSFRSNGVRAPFVLSGANVEAWSSWMNSLGFNATPVPGKPGSASSVKLLRSVVAKGLEALAIECFVTADRLGLRQSMMNAFNDFNLRPFTAALEDMGGSHIPHCKRRLDEIDNVLSLLDAAGIDGTMTRASREFYARTFASGQKIDGSHGATWDASMEALRKILQKP